ncbi:MAG: aspartate/glutamate racemase family protein [Solirubrobacteraceae bacterium]
MTEKAKTNVHWAVGLSRDMPDRSDEGGVIAERLERFFNEVASSDTEVEVGWQPYTTRNLQGLYTGAINDLHMIDSMLEAIDRGADAVVTGPNWDPGLWPARQRLPVPVIGPGESAMMAATATGTRFAMITVAPGYVPHLESAILRYGFSHHAIERPVRAFGMTYANFVSGLKGDDDEFIREFEKTSLEAIADGANVIIAGGQLFGPLFQQWDHWTIGDTGVPIIDVGAAAIKVAEMMVALRRVTKLAPSQSETSPFRRAPDELSEAARESLRR